MKADSIAKVRKKMEVRKNMMELFEIIKNNGFLYNVKLNILMGMISLMNHTHSTYKQHHRNQRDRYGQKE